MGGVDGLGAVGGVFDGVGDGAPVAGAVRVGFSGAAGWVVGVAGAGAVSYVGGRKMADGGDREFRRRRSLFTDGHVFYADAEEGFDAGGDADLDDGAWMAPYA